MSSRTPREDLLIGGLVDWADAGWALESSRLSGAKSTTVLRDATLALIDEVLREGLMVAGDVMGSEHVLWHGEPEEWVRRIRQEWLDEWGDDVPTPGAIVWLCNTPAGDALACDVLARETGE